MDARLKRLLDLGFDGRLRIVDEFRQSIAAEVDARPLTESAKSEIDRRLDAHLKDPSRSPGRT
jgi:putative addiction module component (TIGR02574 family)